MEWFNTAPKITSDKVLRLEKAGKLYLLVEAIENKGESKCGTVKVKKV